MTEICDIVETDGRCRCRSCGATWHGAADAGPCAGADAPGSPLVDVVLDLVRPRTFLGLALWAIAAAVALVAAVTGALAGLDAGARALLAYVFGG